MAIDVPYHYENAPRMVQNVRVESQNNWYLGAHRQATDIKVLGEVTPIETNKAKENAPTWENLPGKGAWQMKPAVAAKAPVKKVPHKVKARRKATSLPMCDESKGLTEHCLPPK